MNIVTSTRPSGLRIRSADVPGRCYSTLTFGVGARDESVFNRTITEVVQELVMQQLAPIALPGTNGSDELSAWFSASGTVEQVAQHFRAVSEAIGRLAHDLTSATLDRARRRLRGDDTPSFIWPFAGTSTFRYGVEGVGLGDFSTSASEWLTPTDVMQWTARYFTASNAVISSSQASPVDFDLDLPDGDGPPVRARSAMPVVTEPTLLLSPNGGMNLTLLLPAASAELVGIALAAELRARLVPNRARDVVPYFTRIDDEVALLDLHVPLFHDREARESEAILDGFGQLVDSGVSAASVEFSREEALRDLEDTPSAVVSLMSVTDELQLLGFADPTREEYRAGAEALTPDVVDTAVRAALPSLIVLVDGSALGSPKALAGLTSVARERGLEVDTFDMLRASRASWDKASKDARVWAARKSGSEAGTEAVITAKRALFRAADGLAEIRFRDIVLVAVESSGTTTLVDYRGRHLQIEASDWKHGQQFVRALRKAVPAGLVREFPAV